MTYKLSDIVHETDKHFVIRVRNGFEVYKICSTHSERCATIGYQGQKGLDRSIQEVARRELNP